MSQNAIDWVQRSYAGRGCSADCRCRDAGDAPAASAQGLDTTCQLAPDPGSSNPFVPGADRTVTQRSYTAFIEVGSRPAQPAPNTLYTGDSQGGTFLYRVYVPDSGRDQKGGVPLPRVTLESADGGGPRG
jgi:hypothetical protein